MRHSMDSPLKRLLPGPIILSPTVISPWNFSARSAWEFQPWTGGSRISLVPGDNRRGWSYWAGMILAECLGPGSLLGGAMVIEALVFNSLSGWKSGRLYGPQSFWLRHSLVIPHSDFAILFVIITSTYPHNMTENRLCKLSVVHIIRDIISSPCRKKSFWVFIGKIVNAMYRAVLW